MIWLDPDPYREIGKWKKLKKKINNFFIHKYLIKKLLTKQGKT